MKRLFMAMILLLTVSSSGTAQTGLEISSIFSSKFSADPNVTETMISGKHKFLTDHDLTVLATFKAPASIYQSLVERLVLADGSKSVGKNIRYKDGKLNFAYFILKPIPEGSVKINRYLYYLNSIGKNGANVIVVYLEGKLSEQKAGALIHTLAKRAK